MSTRSDETDPRADGRRARGERTRLRVLDALLELVEEGELHPTALQVAGRAGVALRTVYHHFEDVGMLRAAAFSMHLERFRDMLRPVDPALGLEERIQKVAHQHRSLFEAITPLRLAGLFDEGQASETLDGLRPFRKERRAQLASSFASELARLEKGRGERSLLDALDVIVSWESWSYLRSGLGRSALAAERTVASLLRSLLAPAQVAPGQATRAKGLARAGRSGARGRQASRARERSAAAT